MPDSTRAAIWDEVLCGYPLADRHHDGLLVGPDTTAARWVLRGFEERAELFRRFELLGEYWANPLAFRKAELEPLVATYLSEIRKAATEDGHTELAAMAAGPVTFDDGPGEPTGRGNTLWVDLLTDRALPVDHPEPVRTELRSLRLVMGQATWLPELRFAVIGPLEDLGGIDTSAYLECWIRNASVAIEPDGVYVRQRVKDSDQ